MATIIYGGVHAAANPTLVVASLGAGASWRLLYLRIGRISPIVVPHVAWDVLVFFTLQFR